MLIPIVIDWVKEHGWDFATNDLNDGFIFIWIDGKRMFGVTDDAVIIPTSYYDKVTGFINSGFGPQVWYASEPDFFEKLERFIDDCRRPDSKVV